MKDFTLNELMQGIKDTYAPHIPKDKTKEAAIFSYEMVSVPDNRKVMLGCIKIAHTDSGAEVWQSENMNVITVIYKGFMYHITLQQIIDGMISHLD